jgi:hypothetical protein
MQVGAYLLFGARMQLNNQCGKGNKLPSTPVLTVMVPPDSEHHGCCWALSACQQQAQAVRGCSNA